MSEIDVYIDTDSDPVVIEVDSDPIGVQVAVEGVQGVSGSGADRHVHTQASAALIWTVNHNLGRYPSAVRIRGVGGQELLADVMDVSDNQCTVAFSHPQAGSAIFV